MFVLPFISIHLVLGYEIGKTMTVYNCQFRLVTLLLLWFQAENQLKQVNKEIEELLKNPQMNQTDVCLESWKSDVYQAAKGQLYTTDIIYQFFSMFITDLIVAEFTCMTF